MKTKIIPSRWLADSGRRLDPGPYLSGAIEAKETIARLRLPKVTLDQVTLGGSDGIFHAGRVRRVFVEDPEHGVPFLGSTDILAADLSSLSKISKKVTKAHPKLLIKEGWTLITRSGTVGRMAFARPDMEGMACTEDVMRVVPDPNKIPPGYLYAFLSSRFGLPMVESGTYGAIIQHIEPEHLRGLPVPLFDEGAMYSIGDKMSEAAALRSQAQQLMNRMRSEFMALLRADRKIRRQPEYARPLYSIVSSSSLRSRLDAGFHSAPFAEASAAIQPASSGFDLKALGQVARVWNPGIFKRRFADDPAFGYPYMLAKDIFSMEPQAEQFLLRRLAENLDIVLKRGMILIQDSGQVGGLIGRAVHVGGSLEDCACTNHLIMITPKEPSDAGYLYSYLSSELGYRVVVREASGSSIPNLELNRMRDLDVPWPDVVQRSVFDKLLASADAATDQAASLVASAREELEGLVHRHSSKKWQQS